MKNKEIYSEKITKGRRSYFFDIHKTEQGSYYLKISESKKTEAGFERNGLMVFEEDIEDFSKLFLKSFIKFEVLKTQNPKDIKDLV